MQSWQNHATSKCCTNSWVGHNQFEWLFASLCGSCSCQNETNNCGATPNPVPSMSQLGPSTCNLRSVLYKFHLTGQAATCWAMAAEWRHPIGYSFVVDFLLRAERMIFTRRFTPAEGSTRWISFWFCRSQVPCPKRLESPARLSLENHVICGVMVNALCLTLFHIYLCGRPKIHNTNQDD